MTAGRNRYPAPQESTKPMVWLLLLTVFYHSCIVVSYFLFSIFFEVFWLANNQQNLFFNSKFPLFVLADFISQFQLYSSSLADWFSAKYFHLAWFLLTWAIFRSVIYSWLICSNFFWHPQLHLSKLFQFHSADSFSSMLLLTWALFFCQIL